MSTHRKRIRINPDPRGIRKGNHHTLRLLLLPTSIILWLIGSLSLPLTAHVALSSADIKLRPPLSLLLIRTGSSKTSLGSPRRNFTRKRLRMSTIWRKSSSIEGKSFWNHCLTNVCSQKKIVSKCSMRTANPPHVLSSVCTSGLRIWAILASISSGIGTKTTSMS